MSVLAHIGRAIEKKLITAVVRAGEGRKLLESLAEAQGVLSVSHHHARGVGARRVRANQQLFSEKDVLLLLVEADHADELFYRVFKEGNIGEPSVGMIFMESVLRGHPMMPLTGADW